MRRHWGGLTKLKSEPMTASLPNAIMEGKRMCTHTQGDGLMNEWIPPTETSNGFIYTINLYCLITCINQCTWCGGLKYRRIFGNVSIVVLHNYSKKQILMVSEDQREVANWLPEITLLSTTETGLGIHIWLTICQRQWNCQGKGVKEK